MKLRLFKIIMFLILGTITNIMVAWGIATSNRNIPPVSDVYLDVLSATDFDKVRLQLADSEFQNDYYAAVVLKDQGSELSVISVEMQKYVSGKTWIKSRDELIGPHLIFAKILSTGIEQQIVIDGWISPPKPYGITASVSYYGWVKRSIGWPLKSLYYMPLDSGPTKISNPGREEKVWRIQNSFIKMFPWIDKFILPYGLRLPSFVINTIFFSVSLWILWLSPSATRRFIRRRRGRCIKCSYDLRGELSTGCPECGWGREDEA
ncbi:MAG: hypothetical protein IH984_02565 [Planctomycetes bacterium]|nr:hypothetical protein [Planctomycetota bacterium]